MTRRISLAFTSGGLRGRIKHGKSGGGIAYGYDAVKRFDEEGNPLRGDRSINQGQAAVVRRIDLHGDLAGILQIATQKQVRPRTILDSGPNKIALVAGAGFEPTTFGL